MPLAITLARVELKFDWETVSNTLRTIVQNDTTPHPFTVWKPVTGGDSMLIVDLHDSVEEAMHEDATYIQSETFEVLNSLTEAPVDLDRFVALVNRGAHPNDVPIGGYCSTKSILVESGRTRTAVEESHYIVETLSQVEGFLGAFAGSSLMNPAKFDSVAFWADAEAAGRGIPLRVSSAIALFRRLL